VSIINSRTVHLRFLDALKILSATFIVLHHLAFYGPMVDHVQPLFPALTDWLRHEARYAVQIFLVIGGFLAARSLAPLGLPRMQEPIRTVLSRFAKLAPPFLVATALSVLASIAARHWMSHDSISPLPDFGQLAAHAFLLHGVLGYDSLWAGAWYVAIDFQLFSLFVGLLWLAHVLSRSVAQGRRLAWLAPLLVILGCAASLFYFNLDGDWDAWAPYFLGSYGLGILAWWAATPQRSWLGSAWLTGALLLLGGIALQVEFRGRIAVALTVALLLVLVYRGGPNWSARRQPVLAYLGKISYAVFLVHFSVCLLVNALFTHFGATTPLVQGGGMLLALAGSFAAGAAFHRWVEVPLARLITVGRSAMSMPGRPA
jgi:peptidoglycan/LPS O-acetylase OafA/YrhL